MQRTTTRRGESTRALSALLFLLAGLSISEQAAAEDACASGYEGGQVARSDGRLREAREAFRSCVRAECPEFIRTDCARWLSEVDAALPSIVVSATADGAEVDDVRVEFDGELLLTQVDGRAVPVDPGRHTLVFKRSSGAPVSLEITIRQGEKNRGISADFASPPPAPPPPPAAPPAAEPAREGSGIAPYVLLGVGAVGLSSFATFALLGESRRHDLEDTCAPRCGDADIDRVHANYLAADVSLAVGVLALAGSGYLFWSGQQREHARADAARFRGAVALVPGGGAGVARWSF